MVRRSQVATLVNGTTSDAVVTFTSGTVLVQTSVYQGVILPLLKISYHNLELYAENQAALNNAS